MITIFNSLADGSNIWITAESHFDGCFVFYRLVDIYLFIALACLEISLLKASHIVWDNRYGSNWHLVWEFRLMWLEVGLFCHDLVPEAFNSSSVPDFAWPHGFDSFLCSAPSAECVHCRSFSWNPLLLTWILWAVAVMSWGTFYNLLIKSQSFSGPVF